MRGNPKLQQKMKEASKIYRKLRKQFPKIDLWKDAPDGDDESPVANWRQVWYMVVTMVMRGLWSLKTRFLGSEVVFN